MAHKKTKVLLGFEDELITKKYNSLVTYATNKAGGKPDWIEGKSVPNPQCQLCGLSLPLIVQIYAPLERSSYHRTLYLFGCVNPNCWNQNESWVCLRSQVLDPTPPETETSTDLATNFAWCEGATEWEDVENGNVISGDQAISNAGIVLSRQLASMDFSDGNEEASSIGATGHNSFSPTTATAEIEGDEDEVVTIDTPTVPQIDVTALFDQVLPVPQVPSETLQFISFFISASEEDMTRQCSPTLDYGNRDMIVDEESNAVGRRNPLEIDMNEGDTEKYEKTVPAHGDKMFHHFISRIQKNPGQILRYTRDGGSPLLLYPVKDEPRCCQHCHGELVYELQLLPTLLSKLQLVGSGVGHIEFGSVFVLSCQRSCWEPQDIVRSEYVIVQREK